MQLFAAHLPFKLQQNPVKLRFIFRHLAPALFFFFLPLKVRGRAPPHTFFAPGKVALTGFGSDTDFLFELLESEISPSPSSSSELLFPSPTPIELPFYFHFSPSSSVPSPLVLFEKDGCQNLIFKGKKKKGTRSWQRNRAMICYWHVRKCAVVFCRHNHVYLCTHLMCFLLEAERRMGIVVLFSPMPINHKCACWCYWVHVTADTVYALK